MCIRDRLYYFLLLNSIWKPTPRSGSHWLYCQKYQSSVSYFTLEGKAVICQFLGKGSHWNAEELEGRTVIRQLVKCHRTPAKSCEKVMVKARVNKCINGNFKTSDPAYWSFLHSGETTTLIHITNNEAVFDIFTWMVGSSELGYELLSSLSPAIGAVSYTWVPRVPNTSGQWWWLPKRKNAQCGSVRIVSLLNTGTCPNTQCFSSTRYLVNIS